MSQRAFVVLACCALMAGCAAVVKMEATREVVKVCAWNPETLECRGLP